MTQIDQKQRTSADADKLLTDHEWRLKMAAEGKAIYVPGRSDEEVKAELRKRPLIELSEVPGGFCIANTRTGSSRYVSDETGKPLFPKATSPMDVRKHDQAAIAGGPVQVPVPVWPEYPDAISPIEAWEQAQAARENQTKAQEQEEQAMITVSMTQEQWNRFEQATGAVPYLLSNAGDAFNYLFAVRTAGFDADECGFLGILDLCGQALRHAAEKEGEAIFALDRLLRDARANQTNQSLQSSV